MAAAVGMDGGNSAHVRAILAEATEVGGIEKSNGKAETTEETRVEEVLEDVLFLHARRVKPHVIPFLEEGDGPVVRPNVIESCVDQVSSHVAIVHTYLHIEAPIVA